MLEMSRSRQVVVLKASGGWRGLVMFPLRRADLLAPFKKVLAGAWVFSPGFNTKHSHLPAPPPERNHTAIFSPKGQLYNRLSCAGQWEKAHRVE